MKWLIQTYTEGEQTWYDVYLENQGLPFNAVEAVLKVGSLKVNQISYGDSLLRYWVQTPKLKNGEIAFSGIRPFGFSGEKMFLMRLESLAPAEAGSLWVEDFQVLAHDGQGTVLYEGKKEAPRLQILDQVPSPVAKDERAPFPSFPKIQKDAEGKPFLSFHAQDDKAGVAKYEIHYADGSVKSFDDAGVLWLDEALGARFLWVYDGAGNVQKEAIAGAPFRGPSTYVQKAFYEIPLFWLGLTLLLGLVAYMIRRLLSHKA